MNKDTALVIGDYADFYPRNYIIINAFKKFFDVDEVSLWEKRRKKWRFFLELLKARNKYDYILVLKEGQRFSISLFFYKVFFNSKIIFDAFISYYDSYVFDRKIVKDGSLKSKYLFFLDWLSCRVADILIYDTEEHKRYFEDTFGVKGKKNIILPVPVDIDLIDCIEARKREVKYRDKFVVLFYGYYIPLQGVEYIIRAAKLLRDKTDIRFILIGSGQTKKNIMEEYSAGPSDNIDFIGRMDYKDLLSYIKMADLNLGIFGKTDKAKRVIPNKALEAMAARKMVLTGRNSAMERYFRDRKDLVYCNMADTEDLAKKIEMMYAKNSIYDNLGSNSRGIIEDKFSHKAIKQIIKKELL